MPIKFHWFMLMLCFAVCSVSTVQYSTVQYSTVHSSTVLYSTVLYCFPLTQRFRFPNLNLYLTRNLRMSEFTVPSLTQLTLPSLTQFTLPSHTSSVFYAFLQFLCAWWNCSLWHLFMLNKQGTIHLIIVVLIINNSHILLYIILIVLTITNFYLNQSLR